MPMSRSLNNMIRAFRRTEQGTAVIEFALALPVMLLMASGFIEIGRAYIQADTVSKSLRAAAEFAARNDVPLSAAAWASTENLVRTGTVDGSGALLVPGFAKTGASVTLTLGSHDPGTGAVPIIRLTARVPYDPILTGLMTFVGLGDTTIEASHEQAYLGT